MIASPRAGVNWAFLDKPLPCALMRPKRRKRQPIMMKQARVRAAHRWVDLQSSQQALHHQQSGTDEKNGKREHLGNISVS